VDGPAAPDRDRLPEILVWIWFGLVVLFYLVLKSFSLHYEIGDENIYLYMAWAAGDHGALPYRDYFFAHPPLHLLPGILLFSVAGISPLAARLIPIGASLVGALFLFLVAKRHFGRLAAAATLLVYLGAYDFLRASSHWTGINLSVMWMVVGLWALLKNRPALSGVFLALGVCTGNYVLPAALMAGGLAALRSWRSGLRYLVGFAVPWCVVQGAGLALGGGAYWEAVYRYHVQKPDAGGAAGKMFVRVFGDNFVLFLGTVAGALMTFLDRMLARAVGATGIESGAPEPGSSGSVLARWWGGFRAALFQNGSRGLARLAALWVLGTTIFIGWLPRVFPFYFLLMFPLMALVCGYLVDRLVHHSASLWRARHRRSKRFWEALASLALLGIGLLVFGLARGPVQHELLPDYARSQDRPMVWADAPIPEWVNGFLRRCCFDDVALAHVDYGTIQESLYHESQYFEKAGELAAFVRENSKPGQTLFGDSSTAGLVALLAGRRLAADEADTNVMRFKSGITPPQELIRRIDTPELALVLVSGTVQRGADDQPSHRFGAFASVPEFRRWLLEGFEVAVQVRDRTKGGFLVLRRRGPRAPLP
jgi:hypothetical protein